MCTGWDALLEGEEAHGGELSQPPEIELLADPPVDHRCMKEPRRELSSLAQINKSSLPSQPGVTRNKKWLLF